MNAANPPGARGRSALCAQEVDAADTGATGTVAVVKVTVGADGKCNVKCASGKVGCRQISV